MPTSQSLAEPIAWQFLILSFSTVVLISVLLPNAGTGGCMDVTKDSAGFDRDNMITKSPANVMSAGLFVLMLDNSHWYDG